MPTFPRVQATVWALLDRQAGNRAQCLGVAEALGLPFTEMELVFGPLAALPNVFLGASFAGLDPATRAILVPPWPDLLIAAGRRLAPVARRIKRLACGRTRLVQVMFPGRAGLAEFDLVAVPTHDRRGGPPNVIEVTGAPHRVTPERLATAAAEWHDRLADLPRPRVALIVGGATRHRPFTAEAAAALGRRADVLARKAGGSLLVTTSRRTGAAAADLIAALTAPRHVFRWGDSGDNPYLGYLALADAVIVTGDSVSMCSEACASGAPVYIDAHGEEAGIRHARLHAELFRLGYARPLEGPLETWTHPPLNSALAIADAARRRFALAE